MKKLMILISRRSENAEKGKGMRKIMYLQGRQC